MIAILNDCGHFIDGHDKNRRSDLEIVTFELVEVNRS